MNFSRSTRAESGGGRFDGIKSRLGFGVSDDRDHGSSRSYRDSYDDYDDGEFGYDDDYDYDEYGDEYDAAEFAEYGPDYEASYNGAPKGNYDPVTPVTTRMPSSSRASARSFPDLVTIDDVRAHTAASDRSSRDAEPARYSADRRSTVSSARSNRVTVDARDDAPAPSARPAAQESAAVQEPAPTGSSARAGAYDPYEAYAGSNTTTHTPSRSLTVVAPTSYGDAEQVAKILKAGDMAVLSLRTTPEDLAKRVLDFSFGVACALDASVELAAPKVFALAKGRALSEPERQALKNQGVL